MHRYRGNPYVYISGCVTIERVFGTHPISIVYPVIIWERSKARTRSAVCSEEAARHHHRMQPKGLETSAAMADCALAGDEK
jgi:hypothetical protein